MLKKVNFKKVIEKDINDILSFEKNQNDHAYATINGDSAIIKQHL